MTSVRWAALARRDTAALDAYYRQIDPDLADRLGEQVLAATRFLCEYPLAGPASLHGGRRKWQVRHTPYLLIYRPEKNGVWILRVLHERQDQFRR